MLGASPLVKFNGHAWGKNVTVIQSHSGKYQDVPSLTRNSGKTLDFPETLKRNTEVFLWNVKPSLPPQVFLQVNDNNND